MTAQNTPDITWALVELMGHRRHVGHISEVERVGITMLRVEVPRLLGDDEDALECVDYAPLAIYSIRDLDEAEALAKLRDEHLREATADVAFELLVQADESFASLDQAERDVLLKVLGTLTSYDLGDIARWAWSKQKGLELPTLPAAVGHIRRWATGQDPEALRQLVDDAEDIPF